MTDDKIEPKEKDVLEQAKPEHVGQQIQQNKTSAVDPVRFAAQGRRPLFRN